MTDCKLCGKKFADNVTTTVLIAHMKNKHLAWYLDMKAEMERQQNESKAV